MKASGLGSYLQQFVSSFVANEFENDEVGLGFDTMLSHDVVKFLTANHNMGKPLVQRVTYKHNAISALDEHELAMV